MTRDLEAMLEMAEKPVAVGEGLGVFRQSKHYARMADLRPFGIEAILHERCHMTKKPNHKLEILETGSKTLREIEAIQRQCFHMNPKDAGIIRVDLTADINDVPVQWFRDHVMVDHKRTTREMGTIPPSKYMTVAKGTSETLYRGVKPNQIRIYNKTGERLERLHRENLRRGHHNRKSIAEGQGAILLMPRTFEQVYGYPESKVITRVERQIGSVPSLQKISLTQMGDLYRTTEIEPFTALRFVNDKETPLCKADFTPEAWCAGLFLMQTAAKYGVTETKRQMKELWGTKDFSRAWKKYEPFMQTPDKKCTYKDLQKEFTNSCWKQIYAA